MPQGTVKWFNESKGFGYLTSDEGEDVYIDHKLVAGQGLHTLREGQRVQFEVAPGPRGPKAVKLKVLSS